MMSSEPALTAKEINVLVARHCAGPDGHPEPGKSAATVPEGFRVKDSGVWLVMDEDDKPDIWVCGRLDVVGLTRDRRNESWGRLLQWRDADGYMHSWAMPATALAGDGGELRARLLDGGLALAPGRKALEALVRYLSEARPSSRTRCSTQVGWHGGSFVLPDFTIGPDEEEVIYQNESESLLRQSGTLDDWKEALGRYCVGNSRLIFSACAALAGPLLSLCDEQPGGFHFVGGSSTGKTTALHLAGSILGGGGKTGFLQSWRSTSNGLESVAEAHNDLTLILDELSQCDSKEAGEVAYMLANGHQPGRSHREHRATNHGRPGSAPCQSASRSRKRTRPV